MTHKQIQIAKRITTLKAYNNEKNGGNYFMVSLSKNKDTFISNVRIDPKEELVEIIYEGSPKDIAKKLIDEYLVAADSSYNSSRPFRWYKSFIKGKLFA